MVLKLYGYPFSNCTRRVAVVLAEKEVPFQLISVDLIKGEQKTPEVLEKQPFGQIPYIVSRQALRLFWHPLTFTTRTTTASFCSKVGLSADTLRPNTRLKELLSFLQSSKLWRDLKKPHLLRQPTSINTRLVLL